MNLLRPRTALRYYLPLGIIAVAAVALLPGDKYAKPAAAVVSEAPARPSYLVDVPEAPLDAIETGTVASPSVAGPEPVAVATLTVDPASEMPMDVVPDAETALGVEPTFPPGTANASVASAVNMRAGPSTSTQTLMVLQPGVPVRVIETNNGWVNVALADGSSGWVYSRYINGAGIVEEASGPKVIDLNATEEKPAKRRGVRLASDVALRAGPGRSAQRLFRVNEGEAVTVVEQRGDWVRIAIGSGPSGWVRRDDLTR